MTILIVGTALAMLFRLVEEFGRSYAVRCSWRMPLVLMYVRRPRYSVEQMRQRLDW